MFLRFPTRWMDDPVSAAGSRWMHVTSDWLFWISFGEAYVQQWSLPADIMTYVI